MITYDDFKKIELRVAKIVEAVFHPNADKLYVLKIEVAGETKQIIAGIRASYPSPEALIGRKVVVVNNLEPAMIRGAESNGMLLAATSDDGPVILIPDSDVPSGALVK
ncbi:MAG: methionine--tRNA ligase subunit beta [Candidatus Omnitrophica bacterium]|jgi:methionyl-tRNA synthetase|nr:methionine--tRNA ligase subunit beta [Candidatus Omnitrophota bacterium]MDD4012649.1 methionine--tRNA ligase subunit beta [Candidatus Omnitrophota bacterium]